MASHRIETYCQRLAFPIGALIFSRGIDRLVRAGRLDPIPYFRRHTRGDWGDVNVCQWHANGVALQSGASLESHYVIHPTRHSHHHRCGAQRHCHRAAVRRLSTVHPQATQASIFNHLRPRADFLPTTGHAIAPLGWCMPHFSLEHHNVLRSRNHCR